MALPPIPSVQDFRARFPEFSSVPDPTVVALMTDAARFVGDDWIDTDIAPGILYLAAHIMTLLKQSGGLVPGGGQSGAATYIRSVSFGDRRVVYGERNTGGGGTQGSTSSVFSDTMYGQLYEMLLRRNAPPMLIV